MNTMNYHDHVAIAAILAAAKLPQTCTHADLRDAAQRATAESPYEVCPSAIQDLLERALWDRL